MSPSTLPAGGARRAQPRSAAASTPQPGAPSPGTNRGAEITAPSAPCSVHWLAGTTWLPFEQVFDLLRAVLDGADFVKLERGMNGYSEAWLSVGGLKVLTDPARPDIHVIAPGRACELLGFTKLQQLAAILRPSRLDIAFDGAPFTPREMAEWARQGNIRCRSRKRGFYDGLDGSGDTLYLGSSASSWYLCAYDKRGFTRLELRLTGERAEQAYNALMGEPEVFKLAALGWLRQFCDFVDTTAGSNISRAPLLPVWEAFIGMVARVAMHLTGNAAPSVERVKRWIEHQVSATLVLYRRLFGPTSISTLLRLGNTRMRGRHYALLAQAGTVT